jgi:DNA-binding MarR family transcriptional regulator
VQSLDNGRFPFLKKIVSKASDKLDLATRAAWLYYVAGHTQHEIARTLDISRPVAQRLVAFAVERNLIRVRVDHRVADCLALAEQLQRRYRLSFCEVVPVDNDQPDAISRKLAVAGAQVMEQFLVREKPMVIALSSGRTLKAAVDQIAQLERPQHKLVSLVGAIAQDGSSNRYDVAMHMSERTGAATVSTASSRRCRRKPRSPLSASARSDRIVRCTKMALSRMRKSTSSRVSARWPSCSVRPSMPVAVAFNPLPRRVSPAFASTHRRAVRRSASPAARASRTRLLLRSRAAGFPASSPMRIAREPRSPERLRTNRCSAKRSVSARFDSGSSGAYCVSSVATDRIAQRAREIP